MAEFLPISKSDMKRRGWAQCDFVYIIGDAYVDHPSFGHAIISRVLEDAGYKVGIISQPDWKNPASISALFMIRDCCSTAVSFSSNFPRQRCADYQLLES